MSSRRYAWIIVAVCYLSILGAHGFGRFSFPLLLDGMSRSLNADYYTMGLIEFGNFLGYLIMSAISGFFASKYGHGRVMFASALTMGVSMLLISQVNDVISAFILRFMTGLGNGGLYLIAITLPSIWLPARVRGKGTGM